MDLDDGDLSFKVDVDMTGSELAPLMVKKMLFAAAQPMMDRYYPGIMAICYGERSAEDAIAAIEDTA